MILAAAVSAAPCAALPDTAHDRTELFAVCTGRLSATMEHQWLMSDPKADETEAMRAYFVSLLTASMEDSGMDPREVLNLRIEAKMAHARLLTRASFARDARDARTAQRMAAQYVAACRSLLLS
ncbi:MAG: hypothetical protein KDK26_05910 [Roseivivax sp.]|nr:hypothetical protein [Roseivivax sp.]